MRLQEYRKTFERNTLRSAVADNRIRMKINAAAVESLAAEQNQDETIDILN